MSKENKGMQSQNVEIDELGSVSGGNGGVCVNNYDNSGNSYYAFDSEMNCVGKYAFQGDALNAAKNAGGDYKMLDSKDVNAELRKNGTSLYKLAKDTGI